jgi:hypothetical protein
MRAFHCAWLLLMILVGCSGDKQRASLDAFVDQDLRNMDDDSQGKLNELLSECLPERYHTDRIWAFEPWYVWRHETRDGHTVFILFQGQHIFEIPVVSRAAVHFLDLNRRHLGCSDFSTGWRIDLKSATLRRDQDLGVHVIEILTAPVINGDDIRRQVYGVFDDRVALLRLEDSFGKLVENNYHNPNHTIGPDPLPRSADEWEQELLSSEPARVLESLTWLGGMHRSDLTSASDNIGVEDIIPARTVAELRKRSAVQKAIAELTRCPNRWIREAAQAAERKLAD